MALWSNDTYLSVWKVENDGDKTYARFSSSSKNKDGKYEQDFFVPRALVVGAAKSVLTAPFDADNNNHKPLAVKATTKVTNRYDKEKKQVFWSVIISKAEIHSSSTNAEDTNEDDAPW